MKLYFLSLVILFLTLFQGYAQILTLDSCYKKGEQNYPLIRQNDIITMSETYNVQNVSRRWLPQLELLGKATYQSTSTEINITDPFNLNVEVMPKDQYQVALHLSQVIWDGGHIGTAREEVAATAEVKRRQNKVDMYSIRSRINDIYFGILLANSQIEQININLQELQRNYNLVESYVASGVANQSDLDLVEVEQIAAQQNLIQMQTMRTAYVAMLGVFIGEELPDDVELQTPPMLQTSTENKRLELALFDANVALQRVNQSKILAKNMPNILLFAQAGFGQPGLNMFEKGFKPFAIAGIQLNWKFGNLYTIGNEKDMLENNVVGVEIQRSTFLFNQKLQAKQLYGVAERYRKILASDDDIVSLRTRIYNASSVKAELGTMTISDLMRDQNLEFIAKAQKIVHEIEYLKTIYDIKNLYNN